jgi:hypothetical protein
MKILTITKRYKTIVATRGFHKTLRRNGSIPGELFKTVRLECHSGRPKDEFVDLLLIFPAGQGYGGAGQILRWCVFFVSAVSAS